MLSQLPIQLPPQISQNRENIQPQSAANFSNQNMMMGNIINNIQSQNQMDQTLNLNNTSKDTRLAFGVASGTNVAGQSKVDEQIVNYVYNRYIEMLQQDKNATIEAILREEPIASQIQAQLIMGPGGKIV